MPSINQAYQSFVHSLQTIHSTGEAQSIARIFFEDHFNIYDFTQTKILEVAQIEELKAVEQRLLQNEPIQYILGQADFYGLKLKVNPEVLIPRQETEELVYWILEEHRQSDQSLRLLDIGTGSACIPIALKKNAPHFSVQALEVSPTALEVAKANAEKYGLAIDFIEASILDRTTWNQLAEQDIIVSNPPYIPNRESHLMPEQVKSFEPNLALFVEDEKPLIFYQEIAAFARQKLKTNGWIYFELNEYNAAKVVQLLQKEGFEKVTLRQDMNGKDRMVRGQQVRS